LNAFRKKLKSMGVEFLEADVTGVDVADNRVERVKVKMHRGLKQGHFFIPCHSCE
jgi:hypothetical protein